MTKNRLFTVLANFSRILVGLVFIFSGFVKAIDPIGFSYKLSEYFEVYGMEWLQPLSISLGVLLCLIEFVAGIALVFNLLMRIFSWIVLLDMIGFTILTFLSAIYNWVTDCGCFGDAFPLTNWETFYKNIVLMIFTILLFAYRNKFKPLLSCRNSIISVAMASLVLIASSVYCYRHLPLIDFLPWKIGNKIAEQVIPTPEKSDIFLVYKSKKTGAIKEYTTEEFTKSGVWQDSLWMKEWEFQAQKKKVISAFKEAPIHDFVIEDINRNNYTEQIINNPNYQFVLVAHSLKKTKVDAFKKINSFAQKCETAKINFIVLTATNFDEIDYFRHDVQATYEFYNVDETALKTMIRSNPGLLLLKNGVIINKWHYNDFPSFEKIETTYLK